MIRGDFMNKDEILAKSRKENKNQDIYEREVLKASGYLSAVTAACIAGIFYIVQILLGKGQNYGLFAVVFSISATSFIVKAIRFKRRKDIGLAVAYSMITLMFSIVHIAQLFMTSTIL